MDKWVLKAYKYTRKRIPGLRSIAQVNTEVVKIGHAEPSLREMTPNKSTEGSHVGSDTHSEVTKPPKMSSVDDNTVSEFNDVYSLNEEIPVVGYTSTEDKSAMQVLHGSVSRTMNESDGLALSDCPREVDHWTSSEPDVAVGSGLSFGIHRGSLQRGFKVSQLIIDSEEFNTTLEESAAERSKTASSSESEVHVEMVSPPDQFIEAPVNICATTEHNRVRKDQDEEHRRIRNSRSVDGCTEHSSLKDVSEQLTPNELMKERRCLSHDVDWDGLNSASFTASESSRSKRNSMTSDLGMCGRFVVDLDEPIHMTLEEVRSSLHNIKGMLEVTSSATLPPTLSNSSSRWNEFNTADSCDKANVKLWGKRMHFSLCPKFRRTEGEHHPLENHNIRCFPKSFKHTLCHWLGMAKSPLNQPSNSISRVGFKHQSGESSDSTQPVSFINRALPPVPDENRASYSDPRSNFQTLTDDFHLDKQEMADSEHGNEAKTVPDFAASIQKVKDCGWYWGPISGELAEKILSNEPDGSFIVRDSSDEHYIFSLTFKLNGFVRHVRIEHDQGNFSFGTYKIFKSHTIVEFIENAVQHSRSGRYLFFLHRRPILGPMRVQLLHPVSRFKKVQSLQHMCRFVILKAVRRDHIDCLPLPARLKHYLNTPQYYAEQMQDWQSPSNRLTTHAAFEDNEY